MAKCVVCGEKVGLNNKTRIKDGVTCPLCFSKCDIDHSTLNLFKEYKTFDSAQIKAIHQSVANKIKCEHVTGLPVAESVFCTVEFQNNQLLIDASGRTFDITYDRIVDFTVKTDVEIETNYVSSVGGAVAGDMIFGSLGAIVGGRVKKIETKEIDRYFIVTYQKDTEIKFFSFYLLDKFPVTLIKLESLMSKFKPLCSAGQGHTSL